MIHGSGNGGMARREGRLDPDPAGHWPIYRRQLKVSRPTKGRNQLRVRTMAPTIDQTGGVEQSLAGSFPGRMPFPARPSMEWPGSSFPLTSRFSSFMKKKSIGVGADVCVAAIRRSHHASQVIRQVVLSNVECGHTFNARWLQKRSDVRMQTTAMVQEWN